MSELQQADFDTADYRVVLRRLTALDDEAAGMREEAERWSEERTAAADRAVQEARDALRSAEQAVVEAQRNLEEVDARANHLWSEFVHKVGPLAERYGRTLPPAAVPQQRGARGATDYLEEVATRVSYVPPARPINAGVKLLFGVFGFAGGLIGVVAYQFLRQKAGAPPTGAPPGGTWRDALPVIALVVLLACPVLAVVAAKKVADRRGVGLTAGTFGIVLITGLVTAVVFLAALRT
jgi:VIT1/CCC1 family predicted Fe2+/Mn2+ transporter